MDCSPKFFLHKPPARYAPTGHVQTDGSETTVHNKQKSRFLASSSLLVKHSSMSVTCNINHCQPAALQPLAASFFCFIFRPIDTNAVSSLSHHFAERHMREKMEALRSCAVCCLSWALSLACFPLTCCTSITAANKIKIKRLQNIYLLQVRSFPDDIALLIFHTSVHQIKFYRTQQHYLPVPEDNLTEEKKTKHELSSPSLVRR